LKPAPQGYPRGIATSQPPTRPAAHRHDHTRDHHERLGAVSCTGRWRHSQGGTADASRQSPRRACWAAAWRAAPLGWLCAAIDPRRRTGPQKGGNAAPISAPRRPPASRGCGRRGHGTPQSRA
jgi:hypothetical protein